MGSLIAHYSFKDIQYSAMMADFFLTIINKKETIFEDEAVLLAKVPIFLFRICMLFWTFEMGFKK